jgi:predicted  nucleic acid-binding Zn-ribbon protein
MSETEDHRPDIAAKAKLAQMAKVMAGSGGGGTWQVNFDELQVPKNFIAITEKDGKYFIKDKELPMEHPEDWQSIIVAEMAKNYLK